MSKKILIAGAFSALVGLVWLIFGSSDELMFKGRPASYWSAQLSSEDSRQRWEAADALGNLGPAAFNNIAKLIQALSDPEPLVRANASIALSRFGPLAIPALVQQLDAGPTAIRRGAIVALGMMGRQAESIVESLARRLDDPDAGVCNEAARSLAKIGPASVSVLVRALEGPNRKIRAVAVLGLLELGSQATSAVEPLAAALRDPDHIIHGTAAEALSQLGRAAVPHLVDALEDPQPLIRHVAATALSNMGANADSAVPMLVNKLDDPDVPVRLAAASALGRIGPGARSAVAALQQRLKDTATEMRRTCAEALGRLGRYAVAAVPNLLELQSDDSDVVRKAATDALMHIVLEGETGAVGQIVFVQH